MSPLLSSGSALKAIDSTIGNGGPVPIFPQTSSNGSGMGTAQIVYSVDGREFHDNVSFAVRRRQNKSLDDIIRTASVFQRYFRNRRGHRFEIESQELYAPDPLTSFCRSD